MVRKNISTFIAVAAVAVALTVSTRADVTGSKQDAELMKQKLAAMTAFGEHPSDKTLRTTVTEPEVNAYLVYELGDELPAGVAEPSVTIVGSGRLSGRAVVDLDGVRKASNATGIFDPRSYLRGRLPVTATGVLRTSNGMGQFELESAAVAGVRIPKSFLQQIVSYYSKSPEQPSGISLDDPFTLPVKIREIKIDPGQAIVIQ